MFLAYSWSREYLSHWDIPLKQHLKDVGEACFRFLTEAGVMDKRLLRVGEIVGKTHVFGKYTTFFQRYIHGESIGRHPLQRHSLLSALMAGWLVFKELEDPLLSSIAFLSVLKHHGNLESLNKAIDRLGELDYEPDVIVF